MVGATRGARDAKGVLCLLALVQRGSDPKKVKVGVHGGQTSTKRKNATPEDAVFDRCNRRKLHTVAHQRALERVNGSAAEFVEQHAHGWFHPRTSPLTLTEAEQRLINGIGTTVVDLSRGGGGAGNLPARLANRPPSETLDRVARSLDRAGVDVRKVTVELSLVNTAVASAAQAAREVECPACGHDVSTTPLGLPAHGLVCDDQGEGDRSCTAADVVAAVERRAGKVMVVDGELARQLVDSCHLDRAAAAAAIVARCRRPSVKEPMLGLLCALLSAEQVKGTVDAHNDVLTAAAAIGEGTHTLSAGATDATTPEQLGGHAEAVTRSTTKGKGLTLGAGVLEQLGQEKSGECVEAVASGGRQHAHVAGGAMQEAPADTVAPLMVKLTEAISRMKKHQIPTHLVRRATIQDRAALAAALVTAGRATDAGKVREWNHWHSDRDNLGRKALAALLVSKGATKDARQAILSIQARLSDGSKLHRRQRLTQQAKFDLNLAILTRVMKDDKGTAANAMVGPIKQWCQNRRKDKKKNKLSEARIDALEKIAGWTWQTH